MKSIFTILLLFVGAFACAQDAMLSVVGNVKGAPSELKMSELKSILKGERQRWRNGNKIVIALMKTNTTAGKYTCEKIYDMSPNEFKKFWLALVFQGKADAPAFFDSVSELLTFISQNPGAIGVVDKPAPASGTHVILIEGSRAF